MKKVKRCRHCGGKDPLKPKTAGGPLEPHMPGFYGNGNVIVALPSPPAPPLTASDDGPRAA
jgi:hypothetical protein